MIHLGKNKIINIALGTQNNKLISLASRYTSVCKMDLCILDYFLKIKIKQNYQVYGFEKKQKYMAACLVIKEGMQQKYLSVEPFCL